jgi:catechol 2,3-dioxygenase-like lactoylglutathione lyase family enzyme
MDLEVVVLPVADVDRAKNFYKRTMGWREDADIARGQDFREVQMTPPGSACSVIFGTGVTTAEPGSVQGLHLVVNDIEAARTELNGRGAGVSEVFHDAGGVSITRELKTGWPARLRNATATGRSPRSATRTATAGSSRKSPSACPAGDRGFGA